MNYTQIILILFDTFYKEFYEKQTFKSNPDIAKPFVDNFIKYLDKKHGLESVGVSYLIDYFCFIWNYWRDKNTKRNISIGWIIGKKARERWENREEHYQYHYKIGILSMLGLSVSRLEELCYGLREEDEADKISEAEEAEKVRFKNDIQQLNHCIEFTTLYNCKSRHCQVCPFLEECKEILKENHYHLYIRRGYAKIK